MNLTVFCATFNPIHLGHLIIADFVSAKIKSDKIIFIPSYIPPHKNDGIIQFEHRYNMVKAAIYANNSFDISDIESKLTGKSYTFNTINKLYEIYDITGKINFIIGTDAFKDFKSWYKSDELLSLIRFIIVKRPGDTNINEILNGINLKYIDYQIVKTPLIEIASSQVRENVKSNMSIRYLVSDKVRDYILANNLYK